MKATKTKACLFQSARWRILLLLITLLFMTKLFALQPAPQLVEVTVNEALQFTPTTLNFNVNQEYLLVILNENTHDFQFNYGNFGQHVFSQYLNGTASVTSEGFAVAPQSKVVWLFTPHTAGEFVCYLSSPSINFNGEPGKIVIRDLSKSVTSTEQSSVDTQTQPEESPPPPKEEGKHPFLFKRKK